jgi:cell division protein FtsW (lipid II flippase)
MNNKLKIILEIFIMIWYIGVYPRQLKENAPSIFLIIGILLFIVLEIIFNKINSNK